MALTDTAIKALKPRDKDYKVAYEKGFYLLVTPAGGRLWRMKFRNPAGAEKKLVMVAYPELSLKAERPCATIHAASWPRALTPPSRSARTSMRPRLARPIPFPPLRNPISQNASAREGPRRYCCSAAPPTA